ncbi:MAG TPA: hypothetical protein VF145_02320 [Chitinophagaceae bacterium]
MRFLILLGCISLLYSSPSRMPRPTAAMTCWVPVYAAPGARVISFQPPRAINSSGKIYTIGNYLFQVERDSGIHVIDYTNKTAPQKIGFIRSLYCTEMSIRNQHLFINNLDDLVVLNIANIYNPVEVGRVPHAFPMQAGPYPPGNGIFFECPDPSKGEVIGWKVETRDYPKCYR